MSRNALRTVWSFIGAATFGFAFTSVLRTTGNAVEANLLPLGTNDPYSAALVAFPILTLLICLLLYVTLRYCRHSDVRGRDPWEARVPTFYFDDADVNPALPDGRIYQGAIAFAFLLAPLAAQCVLALKCFNGSAFGPGADHFASGWRHFWPASAAHLGDVAGGRYRFGEANFGVSYFPWVSPYLYAALVIATLTGSVSVAGITGDWQGSHKCICGLRAGRPYVCNRRDQLLSGFRVERCGEQLPDLPLLTA